MNIYLKNCSNSVRFQIFEVLSSVKLIENERDAIGKELLYCHDLDFLPFNPLDLLLFSKKMLGKTVYSLHREENRGQDFFEINEHFQLIRRGQKTSEFKDGYVLGNVSYHKCYSGHTDGETEKNSLYAPTGKMLKEISFKDIRPALFLDRDGIINEDDGYVYKYSDIKWNEESIELIKYAHSLNFYVFVLTNQSGISQGFYTEKEVQVLHKKMNKYLLEKGAYVTKWYYAPFSFKNAIPHYKYKSLLRKPHPGLMLEALSEYPINVSKSIMVGDKVSDHLHLIGPKYFHLQGRYDLIDSSVPVLSSLLELKAFLGQSCS